MRSHGLPSGLRPLASASLFYGAPSTLRHGRLRLWHSCFSCRQHSSVPQRVLIFGDSDTNSQDDTPPLQGAGHLRRLLHPNQARAHVSEGHLEGRNLPLVPPVLPRLLAHPRRGRSRNTSNLRRPRRRTLRAMGCYSHQHRTSTIVDTENIPNLTNTHPLEVPTW